MRDLPRDARVYILVVFFLGAGAALASCLVLLVDPALIPAAVLLAALIALLDLYPVKFTISQSENNVVEATVSTAVKIAAVLLVPAPELLAAIFFGTLIAEWRLRRVWYKLIFNTGAMTVTYTVGVLGYYSLRQMGPNLFSPPQNVAALILLGVAELTTNSLLISLVVALAARLPVLYVWVENFRPTMLHDLSMLPLGVSIAMLYNVTPWSVILTIMPLAVVRYSYEGVAELQRQTREALIALARVLDERDESTSLHSEFVARQARIIARQLQLPLAEADVIERAAWMHDIGKVGMRNEILFKPGALTPAEKESATRHAIIGSELLRKFPLFEKGAIYVRYHHERWDGTGYPDKLSGEAIPLGARILSVADAFQAMVEERPYRQPLSEEAAVAELQRCAGTQFDPRVVQALIRGRAQFSSNGHGPGN